MRQWYHLPTNSHNISKRSARANRAIRRCSVVISSARPRDKANRSQMRGKKSKRLTASLRPTPVAHATFSLLVKAIDAEMNSFRLFPESTRALVESL